MLSMRTLIGAAVAVYIALPAFAQEAPQSVVAAVNATNGDFVLKWNKQDPGAIAALFAPGAMFVAPTGNFSGRADVQHYYENLFATVHPSSDFTHDIDRVETLSGDLAMATGHWNLSRPAIKGFWSAVYQHQGDAWTMRAHTYNILPPASASQGASTSGR
jgi:uncharacterized protein (TIGR02246 family)